MKIRKGDTVQVISGKARGKTGKILRVLPEKQRVVVERLNMVKRHAKPSRKNPQGTIEREASIHMSNVMFLCPSCNEPVRLGIKRTDGGRLRVCKQCGGEYE
ncbi:MAG: 50S ribosomal protein L24 [Thermoleophilia bacterium]|nr:50S ribosomal protein L24 [Thermoleophilia bacterium]